MSSESDFEGSRERAEVGGQGHPDPELPAEPGADLQGAQFFEESAQRPRRLGLINFSQFSPQILRTFSGVVIRFIAAIRSG